MFATFGGLQPSQRLGQIAHGCLKLAPDYAIANILRAAIGIPRRLIESFDAFKGPVGSKVPATIDGTNKRIQQRRRLLDLQRRPLKLMGKLFRKLLLRKIALTRKAHKRLAQRLGKRRQRRRGPIKRHGVIDVERQAVRKRRLPRRRTNLARKQLALKIGKG